MRRVPGSLVVCFRGIAARGAGFCKPAATIRRRPRPPCSPPSPKARGQVPPQSLPKRIRHSESTDYERALRHYSRAYELPRTQHAHNLALTLSGCSTHEAAARVCAVLAMPLSDKKPMARLQQTHWRLAERSPERAARSAGAGPASAVPDEATGDGTAYRRRRADRPCGMAQNPTPGIFTVLRLLSTALQQSTSPMSRLRCPHRSSAAVFASGKAAAVGDDNQPAGQAVSGRSLSGMTPHFLSVDQGSHRLHERPFYLTQPPGAASGAAARVRFPADAKRSNDMIAGGAIAGRAWPDGAAAVPRRDRKHRKHAAARNLLTAGRRSTPAVVGATVAGLAGWKCRSVKRSC